jgi:membrane fusion protein, multidrug efflux system
VMAVQVKAGQRVQKGAVMLRARDAELIAAMELQELQSKNRNEILSAEQALRLEQSRHDKGFASQNLSESEKVDLEVRLEQAKLQHEQAKVNLRTQEIRLDQLKGQYERYRLEAPFDGIVEDLRVDVGQGVNEQTDVIRIVDTSTLWIEPAPSTTETLRLKLTEGSPAWVLVDLPGQPAMVEGAVLYVTPVADSASLTRRVRVEIANPRSWPAGTQARVSFEKPTPEWDAYRVSTTEASAR